MQHEMKKIIPFFNFTCQFCNSTDVDLIPVGESYVLKTVDNTDLNDKTLKRGYDKVRHISDVLADDTTSKIVSCNECKYKYSLNEALSMDQLAKYLTRKKYVKEMQLGV